MTIVKFHREYRINGKIWFVERYADKPHFVWFWRYGYIYDEERGFSRIVSDRLRSRPDLKRLSL